MYKQILKSSSIGILSKVFQGIGSFLIIRLMILKLGSDEYGIWMTISSTISLISFLDFGIGNNLMNKIALYNANNDTKNMTKIISLSFFILVLIIGLISVLFLGLFDFINWAFVFNLPNSQYNQVILLSFLLFFLTIVTNTIYSIQRGLQKSDIANTWLLIGSIMYLASIIILFNYTPNLILISLISFGIPVLIAVLNIAIFISKNHLIDLDYYRFRYLREGSILFKDGLVFLYLQIASLIAFQADTLILAHYSNFEAVSHYNIVARIFSIPVIFLSVFYQTLWPSYTHHKAIENWLWIKNTFYRSIFLSFIFVSGYLTFILLSKPLIMDYWLDNKVEIETSLLVLFGIWTIINVSIATNIGTLLNSLHILRIQIISSVFMIFLNVLLSIFFTKKYGAIGVLLGSIISSFLCSCIPLLFYIRSIFIQKIKVHANL